MHTSVCVCVYHMLQNDLRTTWHAMYARQKKCECFIDSTEKTTIPSVHL